VGTFDGLNIGLSALYAQRRAIDVAGQNIANVNTAGYSRQRAGMVADSGPIVPALFSRYEGTGQGVRSVDVLRIRDQFLEARAHQEHATGSYLDQMQVAMGRVELAYAEPSDTGLASQLADFWAGWDDIGLNPTDPAARSQLLERATTLASSFRQLDGSLADLGAASVEQLTSMVQEVNAVATRMADLNGSIRSALASGLSANDLMDQRDVLAVQLAEQVGATVRTGEDGSLDVYIGGMALVRATTVEALEVEVGPGPAFTARVAWVDDGLTAAVGGTAQALLETNNDLVPDQRAELATVAQQLHDDVNAIHLTGFDQNGAAGTAFFQMGATGIEVSPAVAADPKLIAAASTPGAIDGSIAQQLATQKGPDVLYRQLVVRLGVGAQTVNRRVEVQDAILQQLDGARESEAGVNIDEEMTNLVSFQHAYSAAARYVTVVDDMLETLIGMV
jgi:flagellar hook-associated protein 1 FlgK